MKIQLTVTVPSITDKDEAEDFGDSLAEHVLDTFNDDDSINSLIINVFSEEV